jgi:HD-GYP domain-containing protein (c-di-GMP phosphodiesterase class II)
MPALAPVVAFEHHLRPDGTGYPQGAHRTTLNLGTLLCGIADVYDAMRSKRAYQKAYPTERILAVYKGHDGVAFDQHLIRRFVQLLGIYPPGTWVRLSTGETAIVVRAHAPDPFRPAVRVMFDRHGGRTGYDVNLWERLDDEVSVISTLDPTEFELDPIEAI